MRRVLIVGVCALGLAWVSACSGASDRVASQAGLPRAPADAATARLVFVGDVMLGRGVAPVAAADGDSVFERLRPVLVGADLAFGNLESPLTARPHATGQFALEADPATASLLAGAGFDVLDVANNHASDAGPSTVLDTVAALDAAGLRSVGGGADDRAAAAPLVIEVSGVRVGVLAYDMSGGTGATSTAAGTHTWNVDRARAEVSTLHHDVDIVVVGLHGGVEYLPRPDPAFDHVTRLLADWGVDVVWGHGAHVAYPVELVHHGAGDAERAAVVAPGLGNALFDQRLAGTDVGGVLEVMVGADGVLAMRSGQVRSEAGRAVFEGWDDPAGDAVALGGDWWTPSAGPEVLQQQVLVATQPAATAPATVPGGRGPYLEVARAAGDVTGAGVTSTVISYRRPATPNAVRERFPEIDWTDEQGRTAHLAVFTPDGRMLWGAGTLLQPVGAISVCDGALALGFTDLDGTGLTGSGATPPRLVAGGAWFWDGFGFRTARVLPGRATTGCIDIDHDGRTDPVLVERSDP